MTIRYRLMYFPYHHMALTKGRVFDVGQSTFSAVS